MKNIYGRTAPKRAKRRQRRHRGVPQLAAQLCGRSLSMVYKVRNGRARSAVVEQAIEEAERRLTKGVAA